MGINSPGQGPTKGPEKKPKGVLNEVEEVKGKLENTLNNKGLNVIGEGENGKLLVEYLFNNIINGGIKELEETIKNKKNWNLLKPYHNQIAINLINNGDELFLLSRIRLFENINKKLIINTLMDKKLGWIIIDYIFLFENEITDIESFLNKVIEDCGIDETIYTRSKDKIREIKQKEQKNKGDIISIDDDWVTILLIKHKIDTDKKELILKNEKLLSEIGDTNGNITLYPPNKTEIETHTKENMGNFSYTERIFNSSTDTVCTGKIRYSDGDYALLIKQKEGSDYVILESTKINSAIYIIKINKYYELINDGILDLKNCNRHEDYIQINHSSDIQKESFFIKAIRSGEIWDYSFSEIARKQQKKK